MPNFQSKGNPHGDVLEHCCYVVNKETMSSCHLLCQVTEHLVNTSTMSLI